MVEEGISLIVKRLSLESFLMSIVAELFNKFQLRVKSSTSTSGGMKRLKINSAFFDFSATKGGVSGVPPTDKPMGFLATINYDSQRIRKVFKFLLSSIVLSTII